MHETNQHRCQISPGDAPKPANDDDHKDFRDHGQIHVQRDCLTRKLQGAPKPGQKRAKNKNRCEQQALVDTKSTNHFAVKCCRSHQCSPARAVENKPDNSQHDWTNANEKQLIGREAIAQNKHKTAEPRRARPQFVFRPPCVKRDVLDHQHNAERGEQLKKLRCLVNPAQNNHFNHSAEYSNATGCQHNAAPETNRRLATDGIDDAERNICAQHIERTVRKVDDPRNTKNNG